MLHVLLGPLLRPVRQAVAKVLPTSSAAVRDALDPTNREALVTTADIVLVTYYAPARVVPRALRTRAIRYVLADVAQSAGAPA